MNNFLAELKRRHVFRVGAGGVLALVVSAFGAHAAAQSVSPPDFSPSSIVGWVGIGSPEFQPPSSGPGPVVDDPAHPRVNNALAAATGRQPTFPVADLNNPILQPWVKEELRKRNERVLAGGNGSGPHQSCWPMGTPGLVLQAAQPIFFIQTPAKVMMVWQNYHQVRHFYLNVPHSADPKPSWFGESVAHYDGDTLIVDTIGMDTRTFVDSYQTPHTDKLHVVERFRLIDSGMTLEVSIRVDDPGAFTTPWNAIRRLRRLESEPMIEATCADNPNNYFNLDMLPIPQADTPDF